jgi:hypothetical protein
MLVPRLQRMVVNRVWNRCKKPDFPSLLAPSGRPFASLLLSLSRSRHRTVRGCFERSYRRRAGADEIFFPELRERRVLVGSRPGPGPGKSGKTRPKAGALVRRNALRTRPGRRELTGLRAVPILRRFPARWPAAAGRTAARRVPMMRDPGRGSRHSGRGRKIGPTGDRRRR